MIKLINLGLMTILFIFNCTGCESKQPIILHQEIVYDTVDESVEDIVNKLLKQNKLNADDKITVGAFINLGDETNTNSYGKNLSEIFFNTMYTKGLNTVGLNNKLEVKSKYKLNGTFIKLGQGIMIKVKIINIATKDVIITAKSMYNNKNCGFYDTCSAIDKKNPDEFIEQKKALKIMDADHSLSNIIDCDDQNTTK